MDRFSGIPSFPTKIGTHFYKYCVQGMSIPIKSIEESRIFFPVFLGDEGDTFVYKFNLKINK